MTVESRDREQTAQSSPHGEVSGFVLAGIGHRDGQGNTNFLVVDSKTRRSDIEDKFNELISRTDIGVRALEGWRLVSSCQALLQMIMKIAIEPMFLPRTAFAIFAGFKWSSFQDDSIVEILSVNMREGHLSTRR